MAPYERIAKDELPHLAPFHPGFGQAEQKTVHTCSMVIRQVEELKLAGFRNEEIENICNNNLKPLLVLQNSYPAVNTLALLGPAGVGKSSLICSLLLRPGVAPESGSAERGTSLVHEYVQARLDQTSVYRVAARYLQETQVYSLVKDHCQNILKYLQEKNNQEDESEKDDLETKFETAIQFFRILLCDRTEFKSDEKAEEYFEDHQFDSAESIAQDLTNQIEEFKSTRDLVDNVEYHDVQNVNGLTEVFGRISQPPSTDELIPHPLPIIAKIHIHLANNLLSGIKLGDTPGVTDTDQAVVGATTNYIRTANHIFVVGSLKRIATNPVVEANLRECIGMRKMDATHLIVTGIDEDIVIKPEERARLSPEDQNRLENAEEAVSELKSEHMRLQQMKERAFDQADSTEGLQEIKRIYRDLGCVEIKMAKAEAAVKEVVIGINTRKAEKVLKEKFRKLKHSKSAPDLRVWFVSNKEWHKYLVGYDARNPPILTPEGTGIPALRHMLFAIPADGKFNTLKRISLTLLPSYMKSIMGILTKSKLERKQDVENVITYILEIRHNVVNGLVKHLRRLFAKLVIKVINENKQGWEEKAEKLLDRWAKYHAGTFSAFCRKSGLWRAKRKTTMFSWNLEIQEIMKEQLVEGFNNLDNNILQEEMNTLTNVCDPFDELEKSLSECQDFQGAGESKAFYEHVRNVRDATVKELGKCFRRLQSNIDTIRNFSTLCVNDKKVDTKFDPSFVAAALQKTYEHCSKMSNAVYEDGVKRKAMKGGVHAKRVESLRERIKGTGDEESVMASVSELMSGEFDDALDAWAADTFRPLLQGACDDILKDFNQRFVVTEEVKTEENEEAVARLKDATNAALDIIYGPLKKHLDDCEKYERGEDV